MFIVGFKQREMAMLSEIYFLRLEGIRRAQAEQAKPAATPRFVAIEVPSKS